MHQDEVLHRLVKEYGPLISTKFVIPDPYRGKGKMKAIVLGADPTRIVDGEPVEMKYVFEIDNEKSPYWSGIEDNLQRIGLTKDNVYIQNVCRNYFKVETSQNEMWVKIAKDYWIPVLKQELDERFDEGIPVLMTTQFILWAILKDPIERIKAKTIYKECISIAKEHNLLERQIIALYRHREYSLRSPELKKYVNYVRSQIK